MGGGRRRGEGERGERGRWGWNKAKERGEENIKGRGEKGRKGQGEEKRRGGKKRNKRERDAEVKEKIGIGHSFRQEVRLGTGQARERGNRAGNKGAATGVREAGGGRGGGLGDGWNPFKNAPPPRVPCSATGVKCGA